MAEGKVEVFPATPECWRDVVTVFEDGGHARKCWCAYWYLSNKDYRTGEGRANKVQLEKRVAANRQPGVIAYVDGEPVGWLLIVPRTDLDRLNRSKPLAAIDDKPVWAMNCFVVRKAFRRQGLMRELIRGGKVIEAYPADVGEGNKAGNYDLFLGTMAAFRDFGFEEAARRLPRRPILRLDLK
ncbi:MAG: GNAT family N-acetyltransferase [Salaquimonas sp.]|nr:GNAT family N-acetyltransferase [Salaquimonas sp.]